MPPQRAKIGKGSGDQKRPLDSAKTLTRTSSSAMMEANKLNRGWTALPPSLYPHLSADSQPGMELTEDGGCSSRGRTDDDDDDGDDVDD